MCFDLLSERWQSFCFRFVAVVVVEKLQLKWAIVKYFLTDTQLTQRSLDVNHDSAN